MLQLSSAKSLSFRVTLVFLRPEKRNVATRLSGHKWVQSKNLIYWTGHFAIYVRWLFGWRYLSSLHSADEPQEGRNSCPLLRSCFIGSCHVGVSKRLSRSISLAAYCQKERINWRLCQKVEICQNAVAMAPLPLCIWTRAWGDLLRWKNNWCFTFENLQRIRITYRYLAGSPFISNI